MARPSTVAMTMFMCLALQTACIRQTCSSSTERTTRLPTIELESDVSDHILNGLGVLPFGLSSSYNQSNATLSLSDNQSNQTLVFLSQMMDPVPAGNKCDCVGLMCLVPPEDDLDPFIDRNEVPWICEYKVTGTTCTGTNFQQCRAENRSDHVDELCKSESASCWCNKKELMPLIEGFPDHTLNFNYTLASEGIVGVGAYGVVVKVVKEQVAHGGELGFAAVKFIPREKRQGRTPDTENEVVFQRKASDNPWVPSVYDVTEDNGDLFFIQEFVEGRELLHFVNDKFYQEKVGIEDQKVYRIFWQLAEAVKLLHHKHIAHRDIKLENIMYNPENDHLKLVDFGGAAEFTDQPLTSHAGTSRYLAPEMIYTEHGHNKEVDIWTMGVVLYQLVFALFPFDPRSTNEDDINNFKEGKPMGLYPFKVHKKYFDDKGDVTSLTELLQGMFRPSADHRFGIQDVLDHDWMKKMNQKEKGSAFYQWMQRMKRGIEISETTVSD